MNDTKIRGRKLRAFDLPRLQAAIRDQLRSEAVKTRSLAGFERPQSIRAAAKEAHVASATLYRTLTGKFPDVETFARICIWLKTPADNFIIRKKESR